jgi:hypothetical protein
MIVLDRRTVVIKPIFFTPGCQMNIGWGIPKMVEHLIVTLRQRRVVLRLENEQLICDAPKGVMSQDLIAQVRQNKESIVEFLKKGA